MNTTINARPYDSTPARRVAFLGLGVMGYPMAGHLALAGHEVTVYNRTATKSEAFCAQLAGASKVKHAETPAAAATGAEIVLACVGNDDDLRQVVLGEAGAFAGMAPGAIFVDHTTASANVARELDAVARSLHTTTRTLRRRLEDEGTSFRVIKDGLRRELAIDWLTKTQRPLGRIGADLGFADAAAFYRAFSAWTGSGPREYRRRFAAA